MKKGGGGKSVNNKLIRGGSRVTVTRYSKDSYIETVASKVEDCFERRRGEIIWVNVDGLGSREAIDAIGVHFGIHPLSMEDIRSSSQRPKLDNYGNYFFLAIKQISFEKKKLLLDHLSVIIGKDFVLSFQGKPDSIFDKVKKRLKADAMHVRQLGSDYLAYCLIDAVVDDYFVTLEEFEEQLDMLENMLAVEAKAKIDHSIRMMRKDVIYLRKAVWPLREVITALEREDSPIIKKHTMAYFRDVHDRVIQVNDMVEVFRELLSGMLDLYLSSLSNRMNEVMKTLTIITTIFIPLSFVVGVYGMNFVHMPEIKSEWGYPGVWAVMLTMTAFMLYYFRKKKWI